MSHFEGLDENVAGIILVGAEGVAETDGEPWLRDATEEETKGFESCCRQLIATCGHGIEAANKFRLRDMLVDSNNRPYWLKAVLKTDDTPDIAVEKAARYTRTLRVHTKY